MLIEKRTRMHFNLAKCACGSKNLTMFEDKYTGLKSLFSLACNDCGENTGNFADINMCVIAWNKRIKDDWYLPLKMGKTMSGVKNKEDEDDENENE